MVPSGGPVSDYSAETPIEETNVTGSFQRRTSLLPWVLFGITAGVLAALTIVLLRQASSERQRADLEAQGHANEVAHAEKAELAAIAANAKVGPLEEQVRALNEERDTLVAKVKALEESKPAVVAAAPPPPVVKKPPAKKTKSVKKKKRR